MSEDRKILRLSSITTRLGELLLPATVPQFWVRAQFITDKSARTGHCYGTFVEVDHRGQERAKLRAVIWRDDFQRIEKTLRDAGSADVLRDGGEICSLCSVLWHTVHGLSLTIFDVDPFMGESHVDRQRRVVLERLQREDLIGRNKSLTVTVAAMRIGLVTGLCSSGRFPQAPDLKSAAAYVPQAILLPVQQRLAIILFASTFTWIKRSLPSPGHTESCRLFRP